MKCARCDRPLKDSYDVISNPGASNAGSDIYVCVGYCKSKLRQTAPLGPSTPATGPRRRW